MNELHACMTQCREQKKASSLHTCSMDARAVADEGIVLANTCLKKVCYSQVALIVCWQSISMICAAGLLQSCVPALSPAAVQAGRPRSSLNVCASGTGKCTNRQRLGSNQLSMLQHEQHGQPQRALQAWHSPGLDACQAEGVASTANSSESQAASACSLQRRLLLLLPGVAVLQHQPAPAHADGGLSRYIKKRRWLSRFCRQARLEQSLHCKCAFST